MKRNKYGAKKTTIGNITFDSKMESKYYLQLLTLQKAGKITDLRLQPKYLLQEKFRRDGKTVSAIHYVADFEYRNHNGLLIVVDVKGAETVDFKIKKKLFLHKYPEHILKVVTEHNGSFIDLYKTKKLESDRKKAVKKLLKRAKGSGAA
ncbi:hypothetical protein CIG75_19160 [Tumebacillus algifaecis]|uniref:DUF1064 domain-containing protein n=1 Tax=Tumebacillus algifaecis TaxID=1214604 RepID=A0A223D5V6_9BACL|nr:DUF1064 domain-containing protein [Tumebacillus algifaecis]ASS76853.1 hypothetical protein CIG75_19160 [Tumebacillus algifaecis]